MERNHDARGGRTLTVDHRPECLGTPAHEWFVSGPTAGFGGFETIDAARAEAFELLATRPEYDTVRVKNERGAIVREVSADE